MARTAKTQDQAANQPSEALHATSDAPRNPRPGSKLATVVDLLESNAGATIAEIMAATSWQQHTVRGALAGPITKKFGRTLTSQKVEGRGRVYSAARPSH